MEETRIILKVLIQKVPIKTVKGIKAHFTKLKNNSNFALKLLCIAKVVHFH